MDYDFNFTFIWRHFDRLGYGLILSLELAAVSILIGMVIGLALALIYDGGGRGARWSVAAYVEIIRNVPLLLLVYLVFYGIPNIGGFSYSATTSFIVTLALYSGANLVEVFRAGLDAVPRGLIDAGKAIVGGLGIVILAVVLDRITQGIGQSGRERGTRHWWQCGPVGLILRQMGRNP